MSIWGAGPFEDDSSMDLLAELGDYFERQATALVLPKPSDLGALYEFHSLISVVECVQSKFGLAGIKQSQIQRWRAALDDYIATMMSRKLSQRDHDMVSKLYEVLDRVFQNAVRA